jgi:phage nucleotide-binding protein
VTSSAAVPVHVPTLKERIGAKSPDEVFKYIKGLIYGEPGAGKTYLFGTVEDDPEHFLPALLVDIDGGTATIRNRHKIDVKPVKNMEQLKELYRELAADPDYYKCLCIDNISELQKIDMNEVMVEYKENAQNPDNIDIYVPDQRAWGKSGERMRIIIRAFRDLPAHVFMFAHLEEREDKITKVPRIWPSLPGKLRHELSGFFDVVGMISTYEAENTVYRQIQFAKTRRVAAKDRFNVLPQVMQENPTIPQIWSVISQADAKIQPTDPLQALKSAVTPATQSA